MKLIPNKNDVRVRNKFKKTLGLSDTDIKSYLNKLPEEDGEKYSWVTLEDLGENLDESQPDEMNATEDGAPENLQG